eukprot:1591822-Prymnesium_polylepis.1
METRSGNEILQTSRVSKHEGGLCPTATRRAMPNGTLLIGALLVGTVNALSLRPSIARRTRTVVASDVEQPRRVESQSDSSSSSGTVLCSLRTERKCVFCPGNMSKSVSSPVSSP